MRGGGGGQSTVASSSCTDWRPVLGGTRRPFRWRTEKSDCRTTKGRRGSMRDWKFRNSYIMLWLYEGQSDARHTGSVIADRL